MFAGNDLFDNRAGEITGGTDLGDGTDTPLGGARREVVLFGAGGGSGRMGGGNDKAVGALGNDLRPGGTSDFML